MDITQKIDAVTMINKERIEAGGVQPAPKSVKIEITNKCSLRCKFCALQTRDHKSNQEMDFDFFKRITEDMARAGVEEIGLFYLGESFMAPELLVKCCEWVKKALEFPWVFLTSNGVNATPDHVKALMEAGLDSLKWSTNYNSYEAFHSVTGGSQKQFENALENIKQASYMRPRYNGKPFISASSILFSDEPDFIINTQKFLIKHVIPYVDRHYWLPLYQMSMYKQKIIDELGYVPTAGNSGRLDDDTMLPTRKPLPCWSAFTEGHVRVDGNLSACCFGADARFDMGLLDGSNFMKMWNSPEFVKLRESQLRTLSEGPTALKNTPCKICVAYGDSNKSEDPEVLNNINKMENGSESSGQFETFKEWAPSLIC